MTASDRLQVLRDAVVQQSSARWTTGMVQRLLAAKGLGRVDRYTARGCLAELAEQGLLTECGPSNGRYYLFNFWSGGAR